MKPPSQDLLRRMAVVAAYRAAGAGWPAAAPAVGRLPETCRRWTVRYAEHWRRLYEAAEARVLEEAVAEAVAVLRQQTRSGEEKVRRSAARLLALHARPAVIPQPE